MLLSREGLERDAARIGFEPATYEKVVRLLTLLDRITVDADLGPYFVLKGGTALNLFVFDDIPRLSVDIDLNYIGASDVDGMRAARPATHIAYDIRQSAT
jgi:predicted nucleotidyltransferase component of viral defense system